MKKNLTTIKLIIAFRAALAAALLPSTTVLYADTTTTNSPPDTSQSASASVPSNTAAPWAALARSPQGPPGGAMATNGFLMGRKSRLALTNFPPSISGNALVSDIGPHHRLWTTAATNGANLARVQAVKEIATGMNYWDGARWTASDATFDAAADGFAASRVQHKIHLNSNLNTPGGAVTFTTPDGIVLNSTPVAIGLYDAASGQSLVIGTLTNCSGALIASNQVIYPSAFSGVCADIVYTLDRGSFQQDVVLTGNVDPVSYGFPSNSTRIQIITEFYNPPEPEVMRRPIRVELSQTARNQMAAPDLMDELVGFGEAVFATGRAFTDGSSHAAPVGKEFTTVTNAAGTTRTFLVESVEYPTIQSGLRALPNCAPSPAAGAMRKMKAKAAYAAIPNLGPRVPQVHNAVAATDAPTVASATDGRSLSPGERAGVRASVNSDESLTLRLAKTTAPRRPGVVIDYLVTIGGTLSGTTIFAGDTTYFVSGPVLCSSAVIEGGAVFKYPNNTNAFIEIYSSVICKTTSYRPAIFTAGDDPTVGESVSGVWSGYSGNPVTATYANPALYLYYVNSSVLSNLHFHYAQEGVRIEGVNSASTISHSQFVFCLRGVTLTGDPFGGGSGSSSGSGITFTMNNVLMSSVQTPFTLNTLLASAVSTHCTIDNSQQLVTPTYGGGFNFTNSVFTQISSLCANNLAQVTGGYNGFDSTSPQFGSPASVSANSPFQSTGEGFYYLTSDSGFRDQGTTNINFSLLTDIQTRTTFAPAWETDDFTSDANIYPYAKRDNDGKPDLGYHYDAIDWMFSGVTVNNCKLTIKPGTAIGVNFAAAPWGIMLMPGGRLASEGSPTNLNVFVRTLAVQESPNYSWTGWYPTITEAALFDPLPEARFRFTDFPMMSGGYFHYYPGPLRFWDTYQRVPPSPGLSTLAFTDCQLRGGNFAYDEANSEPRTLAFTNSLIERVEMLIADDLGLPNGTTEVNLYAYNNLFLEGNYDWEPGTANAWVIRDNIFDHVDLLDPVGQPGVPPKTTPNTNSITAQDHNAYVGMSTRWQPAQPTTTDPNFTSLNYSAGPLGKYYLLTSLLTGKGSRLSGDAGLYHYTSFTSQTKNGSQNPQTVNIGLHYVALVNGKPADTDGDGIPDYAEDLNGNGLFDSNETDWHTADTDAIKFVGISDQANLLPGRVRIGAFLANYGTQLKSVVLSVDGQNLPAVQPLSPPFALPLSVELDTTRLANGSHTLQLIGTWSQPSQIPPSYTVTSPTITIYAQNAFSFPAWTGGFEADPGTYKVSSTQPNTSFNLNIWDESAFFVVYPSPIRTLTGVTAADGTMSVQWDMKDNNGTLRNNPSTDPMFFSQTAAPGGQTAINPVTSQLPDNYPNQGMWAVARLDRFSSSVQYDDQYVATVNSVAQIGDQHGGVLPLENQPTRNGLVRAPGTSYNIRLTKRFPNLNPSDWLVLLWDILPDTRTRNLYISCHGNANELGEGIDDGFVLEDYIVAAAAFLNNTEPGPNNHRYRFVWLDACSSANGKWPDAFAMGHAENKPVSDYHVRPAVFLGWDMDVTIGSSAYGTDSTGYLNIGSLNISYIDFLSRFLLDMQEQNFTVQQALADSKILFNPPDTGHLKMYGYWDMTLDSYNKKTDWPP